MYIITVVRKLGVGYINTKHYPRNLILYFIVTHCYLPRKISVLIMIAPVWFAFAVAGACSVLATPSASEKLGNATSFPGLGT